jgi:hypothetical protein
MKTAGYHPTVETYNMALMGLGSTVRGKKKNQELEYGLKLIADMKNLGVGKCISRPREEKESGTRVRAEADR